jgi:hypothetical protein
VNLEAQRQQRYELAAYPRAVDLDTFDLPRQCPGCKRFIRQDYGAWTIEAWGRDLLAYMEHGCGEFIVAERKR